MKAIIYRERDDGTFPTVGTTDISIVSHLTTERGIRRWADAYAKGRRWHGELYYGDNVYGAPNKLISSDDTMRVGRIPPRQNPGRSEKSLWPGNPLTGYLSSTRVGSPLTGWQGVALPWVLTEVVAQYRDDDGDKSAAVILTHTRRRGLHAVGYLLVDGGSLFRGTVSDALDFHDLRGMAKAEAEAWHRQDREASEEDDGE